MVKCSNTCTTGFHPDIFTRGGGGGGAKYTSELTLLWLMGIGAPHHDYNNFCAFTRVVQHMYMYTMYIIYCIYMFIYMYTCNQGA